MTQSSATILSSRSMKSRTNNKILISFVKKQTNGPYDLQFGKLLSLELVENNANCL